MIYTVYMHRVANLSVSALLVLSACGSSSSPSASLPKPLAVTADWENQTLTLLDFNALVTASPDAGPAPDGGVPSLGAVPGKWAPSISRRKRRHRTR